MESMIQADAEADARNWLELPTEVMSMILLKLGAVDILTTAQNVCSLWRKICKDPLMWRVIDTDNYSRFRGINHDLNIICKRAVDRSCGQLLDINILYFGTDDLLQYISQSSNQLRRLRIVECYFISDEGLSKAVSKFPLLEHLEIFTCLNYVETLKTVGRCCRLLRSLNLNLQERNGGERDEHALVVAEAMPNLLHLQLYGNGLTDRDLQAILDGCPDLESLDLRYCFDYKLRGELGKRCAERIKILHLPRNRIEADSCDFDIEDYASYWDSSDYGYDYGYDDFKSWY